MKESFFPKLEKGLTLDTCGDEKKWVVLRCPDGYSYPTAAQKSAAKRQTGKKKAK